jgi:uncharacterized protein (DUF58 family)
MTPTARGLVALVTAVVLFGLAWQTRIGWFYVVDAALWGLLAVNAVMPWAGLRGLSVQRRVLHHSQTGALARQAEQVFEGDSVALGIELTNNCWLPKLLLVVEERCPLAAPGEQEADFLVDALGPHNRITVSYPTTPYKRGVYSFGPLVVESTAPFGLFRSRRSLSAPLEVTVYSQALPMGALPQDGLLQGRTPASGPPRPIGEVRGSREHQPGDAVRAIHWRNSARRGALMVKELDQVPEGEVRVAFDPSVEAGVGREAALEYAVKVAASVGRLAFEEGRPFRLWTAGHGDAFPSWHACLERLARVGPERQGGAASPIAAMLRALGATVSSIAVVSATDAATLELLRREVSARRLTVLLLEGFAPAREDLTAAGALTRQGIRVVRCRPGGLREALATLWPSPTASARRPVQERAQW